MKVAFKIETLHAGFDKPHHILVVRMSAVGMSDEPSMQDIGTIVPLRGEEPGPF